MTNEVPDKNETATMSRRLLWRSKLLVVVGVALIMMATLPTGLQVSEPTLHATSAFFLILGAIVFVSGLLLHQRWK